MSDKAVIIKRKKVVAGGGHHGGAWKVAYADFVTAMMAFFLLMWLLNAVTEQQRAGLADYFSPSIPMVMNSGAGDSSFNGDTVFAEDVYAQDGRGATDRAASDQRQARGDLGPGDDVGLQSTEDMVEELAGAAPEAAPSTTPGEAAEDAMLDGVAEAIEATIEAQPDNAVLQQIAVRESDEGLVIEVFDAEGEPLFLRGSSEPQPRLIAILGIVAEVLTLVDNPIAITGHTSAVPFATERYTNWELSADRAQAARRTLLAAGTAPDRIARVSGVADRQPATDNAEDARNRRIELVLLRR